MNIKQALKEKNKLAKKITDLMVRTNKYNSVEEGAVRSYDPKASLEESLKMVEDLVTLKTNIHKANAEVYEKQFLNRITKLENTRADLLSRYQNLIGGLNASQPKDCGGWGGGDSIPCIVYTYKKEMGAFMLTHVGTYYDILNKRYKTYLQIVGQAKQGCVRPDFLSKLSRSDEEHLISYEAKSTQIFNRLHNSISNAFINQSAP